ncbi:cytochrome c [Candidatus Magnetominusculus xianensis]|uniref:Cytochrome c n=1 Tax=Candidatus Magnetominusculus xianensis TaxID=1748249 RepID=A0ABR5SEZ5_9BACT|nr:cytochrome c [Candidatus Magnetominusculus xianensis]KWT76796.1 hypothetical protein ASN18_3062 [Candidatus Magnetominusculus xianensis]MBF0402697.1 cytochrome c [Nitrospirota bacterium]
MKERGRFVWIGLVLLVLLTGGFHVLSAGAAVGDNPLVDEMLILDGVFKEIVSAVAVGSGSRVVNALEPMHGTREKTHEGIHSGKVKIPKNQKRIGEFVKLDEEFHHNLEKLAEAARKENKDAMLSITKKLLDGCINCHKTFKQ